MDSLQHRGEPLEPGAGVDRGFRERRERAVRRAIELRKDEIPDLDVAIALFFVRAGRTAGYPRAMVVEDLRARPTGPGVAHGPEIRFLAHARHAFRGNPRRLHPQLGGL